MMLTRTVPDLKLTGIPLTAAIDYVRDVTDANLHVNWRTLEDQRTRKDAPVNLRLAYVTVEKALNLFCRKPARAIRSPTTSMKASSKSPPAKSPTTRNLPASTRSTIW